MVRGGWVDKPGGGRVWREWKPNPCLAGHDEWAPATTGCEVCSWAVRIWRCKVCDEVVYDPDHKHGE